MAIRHRTKEQKRAAAARRLTYSLPQIKSSSTVSSEVATKPAKANEVVGTTHLYDYHPSLIKKDLLQTLLVSLVVLVVELGMYYYL